MPKTALTSYSWTFFGADDETRTRDLILTKDVRYHLCHISIFGRGRRTWTLGTWFWRPLLYQLSYTPISLSAFIVTTLVYYSFSSPICKGVFSKNFEKDKKVFSAQIHRVPLRKRTLWHLDQFCFGCSSGSYPLFWTICCPAGLSSSSLIRRPGPSWAASARSTT